MDRVLLVEDNEVTQLISKAMLEHLDCEVILACNGAEAITAFSSRPVDLILMDCNMPVMDGPEKGIFYVARNGEFDITDGDFLPNGDLLLLERKFNMADGIAMRLRLISGETIKKGATVDGAILIEANMGFQIDNMEALDVWQDSAGGTRVTLMSDDNHSILQRSILLEFKLSD